MKETPIFEEVFMRLFRQPGFWLKALIGGLLSFVPIVNVFAFGYLYRVSKRTRRSGQITLPEWEDWKAMFIDGLRFAVVWLGYWMLPLLAACLLSGFLKAIHLGALSYILFMVVFLVSPVLFSSALYRLQMRSDFKDLLDVALIFRMTYMELPRLVIPSFVFVGIFAMGLPLYGFAFFLGFLILISFTGLRYRNIEGHRTAVRF